MRNRHHVDDVHDVKSLQQFLPNLWQLYCKNLIPKTLVIPGASEGGNPIPRVSNFSGKSHPYEIFCNIAENSGAQKTGLLSWRLPARRLPGQRWRLPPHLKWTSWRQSGWRPRRHSLRQCPVVICGKTILVNQHDCFQAFPDPTEWHIMTTFGSHLVVCHTAIHLVW